MNARNALRIVAVGAFAAGMGLMLLGPDIGRLVGVIVEGVPRKYASYLETYEFKYGFWFSLAGGLLLLVSGLSVLVSLVIGNRSRD